MHDLALGAAAPQGALHSIHGVAIAVPDPDQILFLHFSRFADCPICNLHIADLRRRTPELRAAGIRPIAIFHSPADHVRTYRADMPFELIADPNRELYARYGVSTSRRALRHPRVVRRLIAERLAGNKAQEAHGGIHGLPADFLIDREGRLLLAHYGAHADDALPVQRILDAASGLASFPHPGSPRKSSAPPVAN